VATAVGEITTEAAEAQQIMGIMDQTEA
jgi:hypothetical protein